VKTVCLCRATTGRELYWKLQHIEHADGSVPNFYNFQYNLRGMESQHRKKVSTILYILVLFMHAQSDSVNKIQ